MFLTRMALDVRREETASLLRQPGEMRRQLAEILTIDQERMLWRLDQLGSRTWLVMLSRQRPSLLDLHERIGYPGVFPSWETFPIDDILEDVHTGTDWFFELTASPTSLVDAKDDALLSRDYLTDWLRSQGEACGFRLDNVNMAVGRWSALESQFMLMAAFTGHLTVTDEEKMLQAITQGLGSGREFDAGLLTIARRKSFWE